MFMPKRYRVHSPLSNVQKKLLLANDKEGSSKRRLEGTDSRGGIGSRGVHTM